MSWPRIALGEICKPKQHKTIPSSELHEEGYVVYGANGPIGYYSDFTHDRTTIAVTCRGATCGTINVVPPKSYITGNAMALDDLNEDRVHLSFLRYVLEHQGFASVINGAAQPQITRAPLLTYTIPLPPLEEQKRIAGILDQADALRRLRTRALDKLNTLGQAIFHEMFGNNEVVSDTQLLGTICKVVRGSSPRPQGDPRYFCGPVPRLMIADVTRDGMLVTPKIDSLTELGATKSRPMEAGSVVMAVSGAAGLPAILATDACIHDGFVGFRDLDSSVNPRFLYHVLDVQRAANRAKGTGAIWSNLTTDQVKRFQIPIPDLDKQNDFVHRLKTMENKLVPMDSVAQIG